MDNKKDLLDDSLYDNGDAVNTVYQTTSTVDANNENFIEKNESLEEKNSSKQSKVKGENVKSPDKEETLNSNNTGKKYNFSKDVFTIAGLTVAGIVLALSIWIMVKSFVPEQHEENFVMSYNYGADSSWTINLLPNDFYESNSVGMSEIVPSTFVDDIGINFSSYFSSSKLMNLNYTYYVDAILVTSAADTGRENSGSKLWSKTFRIVAPKTVKLSNSSSYNINEFAVIDYNVYNNLVNSYKLMSAIPLDAKLNVSLHVNLDGESSGKSINESLVSTVTIPLSVATLLPTANNISQQTKTINDTIIIPASTNYVLIVLSAILLIGSLIVVIRLLKGLRKMTEDHSLLIKYNKIMHDYNQIIIEIEKLPRVLNAANIEVKTFRDMLDVQKELHLPILCAKSKTDNLTDNVFYIINQNQIFRYRLNGEPERF